MVRSVTTGLIAIGAASLFLLSQSVTRARAPRLGGDCPYDSSVLTQSSDWSGNQAIYELEYNDANGDNDTGEQAYEDEICIAQHTGCSAGCPIVLVRDYVPPAPVMQIDMFDTDVYWNEYSYEDPQGPQYCQSTCMNGYTVTVDEYESGTSDFYGYNCP